MNGIRPILDLLALGYWRFISFGLDPLSPYTPRAVIAINALERK